MPPKKGLAGPKGKGKAPRPTAKRSRLRVEISSDEEMDPNLTLLLNRLQAMEKDKGIIPTPMATQPRLGGSRHRTRKQVQDNLWQSLSARLDAIEASSSSSPNQQEIRESEPTTIDSSLAEHSQQLQSNPAVIPPPVPTAPSIIQGTSLGPGAGMGANPLTPAQPMCSLSPWGWYPWFPGGTWPQHNTSFTMPGMQQQTQTPQVLQASIGVNPSAPIETSPSNYSHANQVEQLPIQPRDVQGSRAEPVPTTTAVAAEPAQGPSEAPTEPQEEQNLVGAACTAVWQGPPGSGTVNTSESGLNIKDPFAGADRRAIPRGSTSSPLGYHLLPATKERIWKGEYTDVFSLLFRELESSDKDKMGEKEVEKYRRRSAVRTWANWLPGFLIYMGITLQRFPERGHVLTKYLDLIYRAYTEYEGGAWLAYDESFRRKAAFDHSLEWDVRDNDLWLQFMTPAKPGFGERADSGHVLAKQQPAPAAKGSAGRGVQIRPPCWEYGARGTCSRSPCRFRHECSICGGTHPATTCPRSRRGRGGRKPGGQHQQPPPKGPQPS